MTRAHEQTYPALYPKGLVEIAADDLEKVFMEAAIRTPLRERLTGQLRLFIHYLERLGVQGDIWIDGSYATKKPDPQDIDVALVISRPTLVAMPEDDLKRFAELTDPDNRARVRQRWQVDLFVVDGANQERWDYFFDIFSRNPDAESAKGIPFIRI